MLRLSSTKVTAVCALAAMASVGLHIRGWSQRNQGQAGAEGLAAMPWSSFRGNPLNTALARNRLTKTVQSWIFQPDLPDTIGFYGSPSIDADGTVYIGSGSVYALDGATGKLIWTFPTDDYIKSSPAIARNGVLYIGCGSGVVYALNTAIGTLKWQFRTGGRVQASPAIGPDGSVYIGAYDGTLYALDGETGAKK